MKKITIFKMLAILAGFFFSLSGSADQSNKQIAFFTTDSFLQVKYDMVVNAAKEMGLTVVQLNVQRNDDKLLAKTASESSILLYEVMGDKDKSIMSQKLNSIAKFLPPKRMELRYVSHSGVGFTAEQEEEVWRYYRNAGKENMRRMFGYIDREVFNNQQAQRLPVIQFPESGLYHPAEPNKVFKTPTEYLSWYRSTHTNVKQDTPVIGLMFHHAMLGSMDIAHLNTAIDMLERKGVIPLPFYTDLVKKGALKRGLDQGDGKPFYDVVVSLTSMYHLENREQYEAFGVPVLLGMTWRAGDTKNWLDNPVGLPPELMPFYYVPTEFAGVTDHLMVSAVENGRTEAIIPQMQSLMNKVVNLATLQRKKNQDKKIALMYWNYPPGEKNMAASFMNVPRSIQQIQQAMLKEGYRLKPDEEQTLIDGIADIQRPFYRPNELQPLLDKGLAELMPITFYQAWFEALPKKIKEEVSFRWGKPEESPMTLKKDGITYFVIPRLLNGNVMILPQPPRGQRGEDNEKAIYHDTKVPLNHFYMASYLFVRAKFNADALIHLGTHGTQEWTPGKEQALSVYDYPLLALGDVPIIYPYSVDVVGEGVQAKRRGRATIISHQTPPFTPAGLHEGLKPVHDLIHEYMLLDEGAVKMQTQQAIIDATGKDIMGDLGLDADSAKKDFSTFLKKIHDYLHEIAKHAQPIGLHTFGTNPEPDERVLTVMQILGDPYYQELGIQDTKELFAVNYTELKQSKPYQYLADVLINSKPVHESTSENMKQLIKTAKIHYDNLSNTREMTNFIKALNGRYIETSIGGDPIRMPDASPTGRNFYPFDPSKVPTKSAWEAGKVALNQLIDAHQQKTGETPKKLAFTLWSTETMRHLGMLEAQILYALGVKPVWDAGGKVTGVELIPRAELGRSRIDAIVSAASLYRDHFPNVMIHIAKAVELVAKEAEEDNAVRKHSLEMLAALQTKGFSLEKAQNMSLTRVFSQERGNYGLKLEDATLASDTWENESKLYDLFLKPMQYAYGPNTEQWGESYDSVNLFSENLKGVDATVFSRSSNLYGFLNSACPFEYVGGLNLAARAVNGKSPQLYISDLRNPAEAKLATGESYLAMELQTRYFHPGWIKSIQAEGYSGAIELLKGVNNFWGWNVMDPNMIREDQWQQFHEVYIKDKYNLDMKAWFEQSNPTAMAQIAERMLEAIRKDYWKASDETKKELVQLYQELSEKYDVHTDNQTFKAYVAELAAGYGLSAMPAPTAEASAAPALEQPSQQEQSQEAISETVQGQVMQEQQPQPTSEPDSKWWLLVFALVLVGAYQQHRRRQLGVN